MIDAKPQENRLAFLGGIFLWFGLILFATPFFFWWYMSDYDRYIATIHGPFPFSDLGGLGIQLWGTFFALGWGATLFLTGLAARIDHRLLARRRGLLLFQSIGLIGMGVMSLLALLMSLIVLASALFS